MIQLGEPVLLFIHPIFLDATIGTPEAVGLAAVAIAALGLASLVIKSAAAERKEERDLRAKEADAQKALLDALKESSSRERGTGRVR